MRRLCGVFYVLFYRYFADISADIPTIVGLDLTQLFTLLVWICYDFRPKLVWICYDFYPKLVWICYDFPQKLVWI